MILNKTRKHSERYKVIDESSGSYGEPSGSPSHKYSVVSGIDRGNGYQSYISIPYFFTLDYIPEEAKDNLKQFLKEKGFTRFLEEL